ncbi:hypothetical protein AAVH_15355 [Aphelenchoides avenae]|nr:hypothetical protein AAVH_15355 [Aphelenchus avenae]
MRTQFIAILLVALLVYQMDACAPSESKCGPTCCPNWMRCCDPDIGPCCAKTPGGFAEQGHVGEQLGPRPLAAMPAAE